MHTSYTATAKWLHWLIVFLLGLELSIAAIMPGIYRHVTPPMLVGLHMSFGVLIIVVMLARLAWRMTHTPPPWPKGMPALQRLLAVLTHGVLYALLFLTPFAGWAWANAVGWPVAVFGLPLPTLVAQSHANAQLFGQAHVLLAGSIIALVGLHTLAALYHWFYVRDDVLERMLPRDRFTRRMLRFVNSFRP